MATGLFGLKLLNNTKTQYNPPDGTLSATAQKIFTDAFPARSSETALVVLVQTQQAPSNPADIVTPGGFVDGLTRYLNASLVATRDKYKDIWTGEFNGCALFAREFVESSEM